MFDIELFANQGEHPFTFRGAAGELEAILTVPAHWDKKYLALLGHPHSLQGGTMNNKVVTTMARACRELEIASIRFNFRGVGASTGIYDNGIGESEDLLILFRLCEEMFPRVKIILAGFSFGSYVAYRAAGQHQPCQLITIAPPVHHYDYTVFNPLNWTIIQGDDDEVVPAKCVDDFAREHTPPLPVIHFADTGHFFHGRLLELKSSIINLLTQNIPNV